MTEHAGAPDLYARFRPRATRWVSLSIIGWIVGGYVLFVILTARLPGSHLGLHLAAGALATAVALFLWLQASVAAVPDQRGLLVRNVFRRRYLAWEQIVTVRFGERDWVQLDLDDGSVWAVMAIQRVDGERARADSRRLAALVARHEPGGMDARGGGG
ncbi:PH domain-containing protein [Ruania alkalisoli]|uniref:PH domain-containing protein n=1 Tax=Ruania alkalisoli TaxID=2779775 RepID=A0A7M1SY82_9MICO|nr:PH domain-containing protein [Ruania alkalisoli]QOR72471.1 PH domain-containing protein [Ruania alkalisoli]